MTTALEKATREEETRRKASYAEVIKLESIIQNKSLSNVTMESLLSILNKDSDYIDSLNKAVKSFASSSFPLKFNKLKEITSCSRNLLEASFEAVVAGTLTTVYSFNPNERTIHFGTKSFDKQIVNYLGTSKLNCIQNLYFTLLRAFSNVTSFSSLTELQEVGIYDLVGGPNIQTVELPAGFNPEPYKEWFYYYKDGQSPSQGELLVPNLGYAYGGSRYHLRYKNKEFKAEDCSSSVAKWVKAEQPFSTASMISFYKNEPSCDADKLCAAAKKSLDPIKQEISSIPVGSIFVFPSHTGIVTGNYPEEKLIETLSYNRDMPQLEGLGYYNYSYGDKNFFFFKEQSSLIDHHEEF